MALTFLGIFYVYFVGLCSTQNILILAYNSENFDSSGEGVCLQGSLPIVFQICQVVWLLFLIQIWLRLDYKYGRQYLVILLTSNLLMEPYDQTIPQEMYIWIISGYFLKWSVISERQRNLFYHVEKGDFCLYL